MNRPMENSINIQPVDHQVSVINKTTYRVTSNDIPRAHITDLNLTCTTVPNTHELSRREWARDIRSMENWIHRAISKDKRYKLAVNN